jgi:hypothetical protein
MKLNFISDNFNDAKVPKYDICTQGKIINPLYGFIHSPNYPNYYPATQYCQLTIHIDEQHAERVELFLVDMETEALSLKTYEPTDYLEVDYKERFFGKKWNMFIYNSTRDVSLKFRTDLLFNKRGFFLYFQVVRKLEEIDMEEDTLTEAAATTTTASLTTTSTVTHTLISALLTDFDQSDMNDARSSKIFMINNDQVFKSKLKAAEANSEGNQPGFNMNSNTVIILVGLVVFLSSIVVMLIFANR